jgi:hypothetical protein
VTGRQQQRRRLIWRGATQALLGWSGWLFLIALADLIAPR